MQNIKRKLLTFINIDIYLYLLTFLVGFILSNAEFLSVSLPISIPYSVASYKKNKNIFPLIGSFLGYIFLENSIWGFLCAGVLLITISLTNLLKISDYFILSIVFLSASVANAIGQAFTLALVLNIFLQTVIVVGSLYLFSEQKSDKHKLISYIFLFSSIILSTSNIIVLSVSPIRIISVTLILSVCYYLGTSFGAIISVILGACLDLSLKTNIFTISYSFSAIISSTSSFLQRPYFSIIYTILFALFGGFNSESTLLYNTIFEVLIASSIFCLIPEKYFEFIKSYNISHPKAAKNTIDILNDMSNILNVEKPAKQKPTFDDLRYVFSMTEEKVCKNCVLATNCHTKDYENTLDAYNCSSMKIIENGYASLKDFPEYFSTRCLNFSNFLASVNSGLSTIKEKYRTHDRLHEQRKNFFEQYKALSEVLQSPERPIVNESFLDTEIEISREIKKLGILSKIFVYTNLNSLQHVRVTIPSTHKTHRNEAMILEIISKVLKKRCEIISTELKNKQFIINIKENARYKTSFSTAYSAKEKISGDKFTTFTNDNDIFYSLIADGMGCGKIASNESQNILNLLVKLLKSNISPLKSMQVIEPLCKIKANEEVFVTLDLFSLNLATLEATFVKYGAYSSYILRGDSIAKVSCENLALGFDTKGEIYRYKLKSNDKILMISDGISLSDKEINKLLLSKSDDICEKIIKFDKSTNDDKTAILINIFE